MIDIDKTIKKRDIHKRRERKRETKIYTERMKRWDRHSN